MTPASIIIKLQMLNMKNLFIHLKQLEESGDEAWEDLKEGIEHAWKELAHALDSALTRFK